MTHKEIMEIEHKIGTIAIWLGRVAGAVCMCAGLLLIWRLM